MSALKWALLLLLAVAPGCVVDGFRTSDRDGVVERVPPVAVTADQVHVKNAHDKAIAMWDELDYEESRPKEEKKDAKSK